jgi:hypothetical protein
VKSVGTILAAACLLACSSLPEYAAPSGRVIDAHAEPPPRDLIAYRQLERADFRGTQPPPRFLAYAERIGAATCAFVLTARNSQVLAREVRQSNGTIRWHASVFSLGFEARMDRSCSWWNSDMEALPPDYVLQHEQIHFALVELEARRLNADLLQIAERVKVTGATRDEVGRLANRGLRAVLEASKENIVEISREFDEDTSMGHKPEQQAVWTLRVEAELARTQ